MIPPLELPEEFDDPLEEPLDEPPGIWYPEVTWY